jgi:hypothetical protein
MMKTMFTQRLVSVLAVLCLTAAPVLAAGGDEDEAKKPTPNIGGTKDGGGVVKGSVTYIGKLAERRPIAVGADQFCVQARANNPLLNETFVFGKNGDQNTLVNVFVYVSKGLEGKKFDAPKEPVVFDQHDCQYVPHVLGVMAGQQIDIKNSDPTLHNVMTAIVKNNSPFNKGMPVKGMVLNEKFNNAEIGIRMACAVHPWMGAYIHVMEHPFYAVTVDDGTFELRGLPDGEYEITPWHEFKRFFPDQETYKVTIKDGKADKELKIVYDVK